MMQAQQARQARREARRYAGSVVWHVCKGLACAAALAIVAAGVFLTMAEEGRSSGASLNAAQPLRHAEARPEEPCPGEIATLSSAVWLEPRRTPTARERKLLRDAYVMDAEIDTALTVLERNPGCDRAAQIVRASRVRQAEALRNFYVERSL